MQGERFYLSKNILFFLFKQRKEFAATIKSRNLFLLLFAFNIVLSGELNAQFCNTTVVNNGVITPSTSSQTTTSVASNRNYWTFDATSGCTYEFSTCDLSTMDTYLRLYSGTDPNSATELAWNDDFCSTQSSITWTCPSTGQYSILLTKFSCAKVNLSTSMSYYKVCPPSNNDCSTLTPTILNAPGNISFSGTTLNSIDQSVGGSLGDAQVWESFSIDVCANVTINTCGTSPSFSSMFTWISTSCPANWPSTFVQATSYDWTTCVDGNFTAVYNSLAPGTYYVPVMGTSPDNHDYTLSIDAVPVIASPVIIPTGPTTICSGSTVQLDVTEELDPIGPLQTITGGGYINIIDEASANPFPSALNVSGLPVSGVSVESVNINGISHSWPDDIDMWLVSPSGTIVMLMSDAGSSTTISSVNYVIQDGAIPFANGSTNGSGTYSPSDYEPGGSGEPSGSSTTISSFSGNFNGNWGLYVNDDSWLLSGSITSWSITFNVPSSNLTYTWSPSIGLNTTSGLSVVATPLTTTTYTVTALSSGGCTNNQTITVTVNNPPATPGSITGSTSLCQNSTSNAYSIAPVSGATGYTWSVPAGATIASGQNTTSIVVDFGVTSGDVSVTATNSCGASAAATTSVTLNAAPSTPGSITGSTSLCQNSTSNAYSIAPVSGATGYTWSVPAGATIASGQNTTSVVVDFGVTSGDVSVTATNSCGASAAAIASVALNTAPNAGVSGSLTICQGTTVTDTDLSSALTGSPDFGGVWSPTLAGAGTYTYTVSVAGCTDATATVTVNEQAQPYAGISGTLDICQGTSVAEADLNSALTGSPDPGGVWSPTLAGAGTYTYTVAATSPCATNATAQVIVSEITAPNAGISGSITICQGTTVAASDLYSALTGSPDAGGIWSPTLAGAGTYTYTVSVAGCADATATVTVNEQVQPNAGTSGTLTVCQGTIPTDAELFAALGGTPDLVGTWTNVGQVYTYTVAAVSPCAIDATATVTVNQQLQPNAGISGTLDICQGTTVAASDLFSALTGLPDPGGVWSPTLAGAGTYTYTVVAASPCATNATAQVVVSEITAPNAGISGSLTICQGTTVAASDLYSALTGSPDVGGVWSPTLAGAGTYTYTVSVAGCADATATVTVNEQVQPNAGISGTLDICQGTTVAEADLNSALTGLPDPGGVWSPTLAGAGTYTYTVAATSPCVTNATAQVVVSEITAPNAGISGSLTICQGTTVTDTDLSLALTGSPDAGGVWSPTLAGAGTYTYTVSVAGCSDATTTVSVTEQAQPNAGTSGTLTVCQGTIPTDGELFEALGGTPDLVGTWTNVGQVYTYTVAAVSPCAIDATASITLLNGTLGVSAGAITGSSTVCANSTGNAYSISSLAGATNYVWSVPSGATIVSGQGTASVVVDFGSISGDVSVIASNSCGATNASTLAVSLNVIPNAAAIINTPINQCTGSTGNVYSISAVSGATSYTWTVSGTGWLLASGQGTTSSTVIIGTGTGSVSVVASNSCGSSSSTSTGAIIPSTVPLAPTNIIQPSSQCAGTSGNVYSIQAVAGATGYNWSVTGTGWSIASGQGTTQVQVTIGSVSGTISVTASNSCGTSSATSTGAITPGTAPSSPSPILQPTNLCAGSTGNIFSISAVAGATNYTWSVAGSGWSLTAGQGSTFATVTIGSGPGTVSVSASNACGSSLAISTGTIVPGTAPSVPATINVPANQCAGSTGNVYSIAPVSGATSYTWSVSGTGWAITGGQGTTSVTVTIGNGIGSLVVVASNICGVSGASSTGTIIPNVAPTSPIAINIPVTQCSGTTGNVYSISAVSGATGYNWSVTGTGWTIISGQGTTAVTVTIGAGNGSVSVAASNGCGASSVISTGTINPSSLNTPSGITGSSLVCESNGGLTYLINSQVNALSYLWSVPTGWTINSGQGTTSISVTSGTIGQNGQVTVSAVNACSISSPGILSVSVNNGIPTAPVLSGLNIVCPNSTGENYSVSNVVVGATYTWTLPVGASLVSGGTPTSSAVIDFGNSSGTIAVAASNVCGSSQATLNVTVNTPAVQMLATAGDICVGGTAFYTIAGNIGDVLTYSINNSTIIDLPIIVSPFTISIDNVSVNQTLSVITVSNPTFGCSLDYNDNYTVIVHPNIATTVSISADQTTICQGSAAQFTAISNNGNSVPSYQWQVNGLSVGTNNSLFSWSNLSNGDQVSVVLSLSGGFCLVDDLDTSDAILMIVNPAPAQPVISIQNNCGNSVLTASGYTGDLTWNTAEVTPSITVSSSGSYTVDQTVNGCTSIAASAVAAPKLIPSVQLGNDTTICTGSTISLDAGNPGCTYSWTPLGSTTQIYAHTSSTAGSQIISVQVTDPNSCSTTDNIMITVESCAGIEENQADLYLKIYPNPSNGFFYISHDDNVNINQIYIYSEDGKLIHTISSQMNDMIDLHDVARGVYFVKILMEEGEYLERVIVN